MREESKEWGLGVKHRFECADSHISSTKGDTLTDDKAIYAAFDDVLPTDSAISEKNLMRAVLQTALEDIRKRGELYRQARLYLLCEEDYYLYSFLSICYHLNLCPKTIRSRLGLHNPERDGELLAA